jgi:phage shock protein PspC (stress-responsive transcriptional regulator)
MQPVKLPSDGIRRFIAFLRCAAAAGFRYAHYYNIRMIYIKIFIVVRTYMPAYLPVYIAFIFIDQ